jgi:hypothetical protein
MRIQVTVTHCRIEMRFFQVSRIGQLLAEDGTPILTEDGQPIFVEM